MRSISDNLDGDPNGGVPNLHDQKQTGLGQHNSESNGCLILGLSVVFPFLLFFLYFVTTRFILPWLSVPVFVWFYDENLDFAAQLVSAICGVALVWLLPLPLLGKCELTLCYIPMVVVGLRIFHLLLYAVLCNEFL